MKLGIYGTLLAASVATLGLLASRSESSSSKTENATAADPPRPVLLELFTSEGCSSCPPADRLLEKLDRTQPVAGANLIVLSEHVDWVDPFSSAVFTQRQQDYVNSLHLDAAYTPQLVIDGRHDAIGSDESTARAAIQKAEANAKAAIDLRAERSGDQAKIALKVAEAARGASIYVVLADDHAQSRVTRGENSGHTLRYVAVVRTILLAGKTNAQGGFAKDLTLPLKGAESGAWRVVVFLQDSGSKHILGAAQTHL